MLALFPGRDREYPVPEAFQESLAVLVAHGTLGTDAAGNATLAEIRHWFAEHEVDDRGEREAWRIWFRAIDAAVARFHKQQFDEATRDRPR
jgi:hypothetical protein